jgi:hypothetical protein
MAERLKKVPGELLHRWLPKCPKRTLRHNAAENALALGDV